MGKNETLTNYINIVNSVTNIQKLKNKNGEQFI